MTLKLNELLESRLLLVTGKGGTGKTTSAVALARLAADRGRRVVLVEVDNQHPSLSEHFGVRPEYEPRTVAPGLDIANLTWMECLVEWLRGVVPVVRLVRLILNNRMVRLFLDVAPGSREMVVFARLLDLVEEYDLVVVDLPASGHAVSFFLVPYRASSLFQTGPLHRSSHDILATLRKASTRIVVVSLPEEMVVNETVETCEALEEIAPELAVSGVILNQALEPRFSDAQKDLMERLYRRFGHPEASADEHQRLRQELVRAGRWEAERELATAEAVRRIRSGPCSHVQVVPVLVGDETPGSVVQQVATILARDEDARRKVAG